MNAETAMLINLHLKTGEKVTNTELLDASFSIDRANEVHEDVVAYLDSYTGDFEYLVEMRAAKRPLTVGQMRGVLNCMIADQRRKAKADKPTVTLTGGLLYKIDGLFYKTKDNQSKTKVYGMLLVPKMCCCEGCASPAAGQVDGRPYCKAHADGFGYALSKIKHTWSYDSGVHTRKIRDYVAAGGTPMTISDMEAWGVMFGVCLICGATLTNPTSVARGIGPICAGRYPHL